MAWYGKLGRTLYAVVPFVLTGTLIIFSVYFLDFTTESVLPSSLGSAGYTVTIHPSQTYIYNVTVTYGRLPPNWFTSTAGEQGNTTIMKPAMPPDTITSWARGWLPIMVRFNGSQGAGCRFNATAEDMNGVIKWRGDVTDDWAIPGRIGAWPEITQERTIRLYLTNLGSVDVIAAFNWDTEYHFFNKPMFYYGIAGLIIALLYPLMSLARVVSRFIRHPKDLENSQEKTLEASI